MNRKHRRDSNREVRILINRYEDHVNSCDKCGEMFDCDDCIDNETDCHELCPIGESLEDAWVDLEEKLSAKNR